MVLYFHKAEGGNFGDDLNAFLWPRIIPDVLSGTDGCTFIGIGSIFDRRLNTLAGTKVVFGTGVNSQGNLPDINASYDIRFVRGPISSHAMGLGSPWITDSAYALALLKWTRQVPAFDVAFMPHFLTVPYLDWPTVCEELGFRYINPQAAVEDVIGQLRSCRRLITEAMHGAIVADVFRIPWLRVDINAWQKEDFGFSTVKWLDWGLSLGVDVTPVHLDPLHQWGRRMLFNPVRLKDRFVAARNVKRALKALPTTGHFRVSREESARLAISRIESELGRLAEDYCATR
jgi:succinoglycan biosynthesis protein ExoV